MSFDQVSFDQVSFDQMSGHAYDHLLNSVGYFIDLIGHEYFW